MSGGGSEHTGASAPYQQNYTIKEASVGSGYFPSALASAAPVRLMLSCNSCRKKKIRCNGAKPVCESCQKSSLECIYSPVGPRKKPRRAAQKADGHSANGIKEESSRRSKRQASLVSSDEHSAQEGVTSTSHLMRERVRETEALELPQQSSPGQPMMEMLRLQTQISALVDQLRSVTIRASGVTPAQTPTMSAGPSPREQPEVAKESDGSLHLAGTEHARGLNVSRDLISHLIGVYFEYSHPAETGMHPAELYRERLQRAQVSEPFLLSVLAVASRLSDDARVKREPAYLAGYDFFERVTRGLMMDVLERDCVENMLTLNNLAVYAVGLPVANRGWYFSGLAMRMATQMSLQKVDAPGRMPGASMMSGPGIESARRAFWTTLLLEALASFASGEPPPITIQDIHVAEPFDDPSMLDEDGPRTDDNSSRAASDAPRSRPPNVSAYVAQLALLLVRVARLNGNRHPESAQFSPEYAALHAEMVAWYHGLPDSMQIKPTVARDEIRAAPQAFAAKMFVHCHYHAAIIALHQPRVDLVRVESAGGLGGYDRRDQPQEADQQWRQLAQQQCLTAACSMTELLALARALDVRYHIVTFGFAVFMAGVVHVGAVACTPRDSTERQYSINCVKEHVRCLDRLGKYFAFHFIMAKHIRAQLQTIEATDLRRQSAAMTASRPPAFPPTMSLAFPQMPTALAMDQAMPDLGLSGLAFLEQPQPPPVSQSESWFSSPGASLSNAPSVDLLSGLFGSPPAATPPPVLPSDAQSMIFGMQGMQGMQGMSGLASLGSLAELFSPSRDGSSSSTPLYPEKILNSSQLAPPRHQSASRQHRTASTDDVNMANQSHSAAQSQADPAAPLRLTSPGGFQQFGSLPPFSPL